MDKNAQAIKRLSCYAVLKSGYSGENYLQPHMRLVLFLIAKKKYAYINPQTVTIDFLQEYGYSIAYFPMIKILGLAVEHGYLHRQINQKKYLATEKISEFDTLTTELKVSEANFNGLVIMFKHFVSKFEVDYSTEIVESIIISYINTQKLMHISGHIENTFSDKRIDFLFGKFILELKETNTTMFHFLTRMAVGSILADCITFHEKIEDSKSLSNQTIIIDTDVAFRVLGVDIANRVDYYRELIKTLQEKGATICIYRHSYEEMQRIILGARDWVSSYSYDPAKASTTTEYFREIGAGRDDVEEFSILLMQKLTERNISLIDVDYSESTYDDHVSEEALYRQITDFYRQTSRNFNEGTQRNTVELDAKSLSLIFRLRAGSKPNLISDASHIFITTNASLAQIACMTSPSTGVQYYHSVPVCITDVFLGTFIWLNDPVKIQDMNEKQIIANAYTAFQPNDILLEKLVRAVNHLLEQGHIDSETCYALKSNKLVFEKLAKKTLGDPDAFSENTPLEILQEIREEAKEEGRAEKDVELSNVRDQFNQELEKTKHLHDKLVIAQQQEMVRLMGVAIEGRESLLSQMAKDEKRVNRIKLLWQIIVIAAIMITFGVGIIGIISIWQFGQANQMDYLGLICALVAFILFMTSVIYGIVKKKITLVEWGKNLVALKYDRACKKCEFSPEKKELLSIEVNDLKSQKAELNNKVMREHAIHDQPIAS